MNIRPSHGQQPAWAYLRPGLLAFFIMLLPTVAEAHIGLMSPTSRYGPNILKTGPCGAAGGSRSNNVFTFAPGQTITVIWDEYIDHPGHFRISFDEDGDDDFVDPPCINNCTGYPAVFPDFEQFSNDTVLMDGIQDTSGGLTTIQVQLPDIECDNCTLQVIQVMYDKPPYVNPGNDIYYQCIDLILTRQQNAPDAGVDDAGVDDAGVGDAPDEGSGCECVIAPRHPTTLLFALGVVVFGWLRRRRSSL